MFTERMDNGWRWIRERERDWKTEGEQLLIRSRPGSIWGTGNDAENVLIRPFSGPEGSVSVIVSGDMDIAYEQAGLLLFYDEDNYIKFVKELVGEELGREERAEAKVVGKATFASHTVELKLTIAAGTVEAYYREGTDGEWIVLAACDGFPLENPHVGLLTHGGSAEEENWFRYSRFRINP
ncbi:hypothetical protein MO973_01145 [Paenibacillus sp. TRM 82003]|nr:hypothetical protein [Paenibacillus sp. TRM 82003]